MTPRRLALVPTMSSPFRALNRSQNDAQMRLPRFGGLHVHPRGLSQSDRSTPACGSVPWCFYKFKTMSCTFVMGSGEDKFARALLFLRTSRTVGNFPKVLDNIAETTIMDNSPTRTYMPAEWTTHRQTLTAFPELSGANNDAASLEAARGEVAAVANAISEFELVWLYASPSALDAARNLVNGSVMVKEAAVDNLWIRDLGPVFVRSGDLSSGTNSAIDLNFNYWGNKIPPTIDPSFARRILSSDFEGVTRHQAGIVSEGGALEVDGEGTLLVTDSSILNPNRNPGVSKEEVEAELKRWLGVSKIIWLTGVMGLESTDWHVDAFVRFIGPGQVIVSKPPANAHQKLHEVYSAAIETFQNTCDARGRSFTIHVCQEPDQEKLPKGFVEGMVTSYVNYLLVNGGIILARFGQTETDDAAKEQLSKLFPKRRMVQIDINELPKLGGGIHCATQHVPI